MPKTMLGALDKTSAWVEIPDADDLYPSQFPFLHDVRGVVLNVKPEKQQGGK